MENTTKVGFVFVVKWKDLWAKVKMPFGRYPSHVFVEAPNTDWARGKLRHWLDTSGNMVKVDSYSTDGQRMEVLE